MNYQTIIDEELREELHSSSYKDGMRQQLILSFTGKLPEQPTMGSTAHDAFESGRTRGQELYEKIKPSY